MKRMKKSVIVTTWIIILAAVLIPSSAAAASIIVANPNVINATEIQAFDALLRGGDTSEAAYNITNKQNQIAPILIQLFINSTENISPEEFSLLAAINDFALSCAQLFPAFWNCTDNGDFYKVGSEANETLILALSLNLAASPAEINYTVLIEGPPDMQPPFIQLIAPPNGSRINTGTIINFSVTDDIKVDAIWFSRTVQDDFNDGNDDGWAVVSGNWSVVNGEYRGNLSGETIWGDGNWMDYFIEGDVRPIDAGKDAILRARYNDTGNQYYAGIGSWGHKYAIGKIVNGTNSKIAGTGSASEINFNQTYRLRFLLNGSYLALFDNGTLVLSATDTSLIRGKAGLGVANTHAAFDNIIIHVKNETIFNTTIPAPEIHHIFTDGWPEGYTTIRIYANDTSGNENSSSFVFIFDDTKPSVKSLGITPSKTFNPTYVKAGLKTVLIEFSERMDTSIQPAVRFGAVPNFTARAVIGGWRNSTTWSGIFFVSQLTGKGNNTFSIRSARDLTKNIMEMDVSHSFIIDTAPPRVSSLSLSQSPIKGTNVNFTAGFNEPMDTSINPNVAFARDTFFFLTSPKTTVSPIGWLNSTTWRGNFTFNSSFGDGRYRILVEGGEDLAGNSIARNTSSTFEIDRTMPAGRNPQAADIYATDNETIVIEVLDPGSTGIAAVMAVVNGTANGTTNFSMFLGYRKTAPSFFSFFFSPSQNTNVPAVYFVNISNETLLPGNHTVRFYIFDNAGNLNNTISKSFFVNSSVNKSYGGKIAYLCRTSACSFGTEGKIISWLRNESWNVTGKAYNQWTSAELDSYDVMACSDQFAACNIRPGSPAYNKHRFEGKPFIEFADTSTTRAGFNFGYVSRIFGSSITGTSLFITGSDQITAGHFMGIGIFSSPKRVSFMPDTTLNGNATDLADFGNDRGNSAIFKVDNNAMQGRYVWIGWFQGFSFFGRFYGTEPNDLTLLGKRILKRAVSWAQCGNSLGCV